MKRRVGLAAAVVVPVVVISFALEGFVRDVLIGPLLYAGWILRLFFESIPQEALWTVFLIGAAIFLARTIIWRRPVVAARREAAPASGRVEELARLISDANRDHVAGWRLAQRLGQLAINILAAQERLPPRDLWRRLERGTLGVPPRLQGYLKLRNLAQRPARRGLRRRPAGKSEVDPEEVIRFLEERAQLPGGGSP